MFKNDMKIALRSFTKQRLYTFINIFGLSVGISCCLLIMLYVKQELSYDRFYPNVNRIYRLAQRTVTPQRTSLAAATPVPLAPALKEKYPEVEHATRIFFDTDILFEYKNKRIFENNVIFADPEFFKVFPFELLKGDPNHLLDSPDSMVITASMAQKYFGEEDPLGKVFRIDNQDNFRVTGVIRDVPVNSHFHFDVAFSFLAKNEQNFGIWLELWTGYTTLYTYAVLIENINIDEFSRKVENIIGEHSKKSAGIETKVFLQSLKDIHLHSHIEDEIEPNNDISTLIILSTIAFLILAIACINTMNLTTAQSEKRAKEVGIRKVLGAGHFQLVRQFIGESSILTAMAVFLSIVSVEVFLPAFSSLVGKSVDLNYGQDFIFLIGFFAISFFVSNASSIYPAVILSGHQPVKALKGLKDSLKHSLGQLFFKKILVAIQFCVSILLIICTIVINQQLHYMRHAHLGFDKEHTIVIPVQTDSGRRQVETIKRELVTEPSVVSATACLKPPIGENVIIIRAFPRGRDAEESFLLYVNSIDYDYINHFDIEVVAGRNISRDYSTDLDRAFIVNEATVRKLGFSSPDEALGKKLITGWSDLEGRIVGVTKNYHISSFHEEIEPQLMFFDAEYLWTIAVKIRTDNMPAALASIEKVFARFRPEHPFSYSFLDEDIDRLYKGEEQTAQIIQAFSMTAISIACLGLLGLAAFTAERRTKEIGIRKALGASVSNILFLLSSEFMKWVLVANIIAWPVAFYAMNKWLQAFAYRVNISPWSFLLAAILAVAIALFTVSYQAIKAALTDPVEALRYE